MTAFCFLWLPLFYLFWRSVIIKNIPWSLNCIVWPVVSGFLIFFIIFFAAPFIRQAEGFGIKRFLSAFFDYAPFPPLLALLFYAVLSFVLNKKPEGGCGNFLLLASIPAQFLYAVEWAAKNHPLYLVLPPFLWTLFCLSANLFSYIFKSKSFKAIAGLVFCSIVMQFLCAAAWWAFFCQKNLYALTIVSINAIVGLLGVFAGGGGVVPVPSFLGKGAWFKKRA
ncbi:MAG: hypothetical protein LBC53_05205 [Spirochaetaceae bacterium]|jgi:hypothetical protein|nr:hypothetical protein [Spirochaetaceae bacterium]